MSRVFVRALLIGLVVGAFAYHVARKLHEREELTSAPLGSAAITVTVPSIAQEMRETAAFKPNAVPYERTWTPAAPPAMTVGPTAEPEAYTDRIAELQRRLRRTEQRALEFRRAAEVASVQLAEGRQEMQNARTEAAQQAERLLLLVQEKEESERKLALAIERARTPIMPPASSPQQFTYAAPAAGSSTMSSTSPRLSGTASSSTTTSSPMIHARTSDPASSPQRFAYAAPAAGSSTMSSTSPRLSGIASSSTTTSSPMLFHADTSDLLVSMPLRMLMTDDDILSVRTAITSIADALRDDPALCAQIIVSSKAAAAIANKSRSEHDTAETVAARHLRDLLLAAGVVGTRLEIGVVETREMRRLTARPKPGALLGATAAAVRQEEPAIHIIIKR